MARKTKIKLRGQDEQLKLFEVSSFVANPNARDEDIRNFALALENLSENTFVEIIKTTEKNLLTDPDEEISYGVASDEQFNAMLDEIGL